MNLVDCFVKRINGVPFQRYGKWWIEVDYISWGATDTCTLTFDTFEEANSVREGYKFLA